jgi:hypothetical protein
MGLHAEGEDRLFPILLVEMGLAKKMIKFSGDRGSTLFREAPIGLCSHSSESDPRILGDGGLL